MAKRTAALGVALQRGRSWFGTTLWVLPAAGIAVAAVTGVLLPRVDRSLLPGTTVVPFLFDGGAAAARDSLAVIAGSLISVTGLVFSLTMIALQLSSSQYSPRLLRTFAADPHVRWTLTVLVLTFTFALVVLQTVRSESAATVAEGTEPFVPRLSIGLAYLLAIASVLAVVLFIGHLARSLRVETMLLELHEEAARAVERRFPPEPTGAPERRAPAPAGLPVPVPARTSGFLVDVYEQRLVDVAARHDIVLVLAPRFGDSVIVGSPVAHAWTDDPRLLDVDTLAAGLDGALRVERERRGGRDIAHDLRTMVDLAVRALSPGVNDPTTAVVALSHISSAVGEILVHRPDRLLLSGELGEPRAVLREWRPAELLELAVEEPVQFAAGQPAVLRRLADLLREVAWRAPQGMLDRELAGWVSRVAEQAAATTAITAEERSRWQRRVQDAMAGRWAPAWPDDSRPDRPSELPAAVDST
jgi:uncharacterized membrane protein